MEKNLQKMIEYDKLTKEDLLFDNFGNNDSTESRVQIEFLKDEKLLSPQGLDPFYLILLLMTDKSLDKVLERLSI